MIVVILSNVWLIRAHIITIKHRCLNCRGRALLNGVCMHYYPPVEHYTVRSRLFYLLIAFSILISDLLCIFNPINKHLFLSFLNLSFNGLFLVIRFHCEDSFKFILMLSNDFHLCFVLNIIALFLNSVTSLDLGFQVGNADLSLFRWVDIFKSNSVSFLC